MIVKGSAHRTGYRPLKLRRTGHPRAARARANRARPGVLRSAAAAKHSIEALRENRSTAYRRRRTAAAIDADKGRQREFDWAYLADLSAIRECLDLSRRDHAIVTSFDK